jgi:phosphatidylglycerol:prolipoprotein diacylglycerol transferase
MRSILFTIPLDGRLDLGPLGQIPVFGVGLLLALWLLVGAGYVIAVVRRHGRQHLGWIVPVVWTVVATAIIKFPDMRSLPVYGYGTMLFFGFLASASLASKRLRQEGADGEIAWDAAMWIFFAGLLGSRTFYVIQYHDHFFGPDPLTGKPRTLPQILVALINLPDGGLVLYGGLIFAPLAYYLFCRLRGVRPLAFADIAITSVFVGIMFGRLGCLLHGCCYGDVCTLPWAMTFPAGSVPFDSLVSRGLLSEHATCSLALHPTQLYDSISGLLLALVTWAYYPYRRRTSEVLALGWIAYPINRFMIEFLRSDEAGQFGTTLTIAQWVSLGLLVSGVVFYLALRYVSPGRQPVIVTHAPTSTT